MRPSVLPQSGTSCWYGQQAYTANIRISLTAVLRFVSHKNNAQPYSSNTSTIKLSPPSP